MKITEKDIKELGLAPIKRTYITIDITADVNDGDYIHSSNEIGSLDEYKKVSEIVGKIESYSGGHNWENCADYLTEDEIELFDEYTPYMDNECIHSIESVEFTLVIDGVIYG